MQNGKLLLILKPGERRSPVGEELLGRDQRERGGDAEYHHQ